MKSPKAAFSRSEGSMSSEGEGEITLKVPMVAGFRDKSSRASSHEAFWLLPG